MKQLFRIGLCLALVSVALGDTRLVDLGARKVRVRMEGAGPTGVFEGGFTESLDAWRDVIPEVAKIARVFAYDRAGMGQSDFVEGERSYAQMYPSEVRGIVFVDPMSETLIINDPKRAEHMAQQASVLKNANRGILAEWAYLQKEADRSYTDLLKVAKPNVPMALIVASIDRPEGWRKALLDQYGSWLADRNDSLIVATPSSSHNVQRDDPALVVSAIRTLLFPNPLVALDAAATRGGADAVIATFREQQATYPKADITPRALNTIGYRLLQKKRPADALKVFALNAATFPEDANAYDSLGEAYLANGDREAALTSYRKAFAMDPTNNNAKKVIEELEK